MSHTEKIEIYTTEGINAGQDTAKKELKNRKSAIYVRKHMLASFKLIKSRRSYNLWKQPVPKSTNSSKKASRKPI